MENGILKAEGSLRFFALVFLVLTACLVRLDTQTKFIIISERKATYKDMKAFVIFVTVEFAAAGFHLLQLSKCLIIASVGGKTTGSCPNLAWLSFFLDQIVTYVSFGTFSAATQASVLAIIGESQLEWTKLCDRYTRFCYQIGGALFCGLVSLVVMAVITSISSFNLFRLYSHKRFLILKGQ
ncbi:CASP-like protein 2C1 [Macadamia integrifolia]|uniref:CASP-like protein 2C1 n=1 Tax=Macadamia integrifolia TaxID=60698 RepID=UPI001C4EAB14|nr:CASP-like protein 2C1 [Macadamia integrifolia]